MLEVFRLGYKSLRVVRKERKFLQKKLLCLDVPTRWNSTYLMLESAEKFQKAFERLENMLLNIFVSFVWVRTRGLQRPWIGNMLVVLLSF